MKTGMLPKHVAIIPDGNRRWAKARGLPTFMGHRKGFERAKEIVNASREMGIHTLTLWAFSTENWNRDKKEIDYLMKLYSDMIDDSLRDAHKYQSRIIHLGRKDRIPKSLAIKIEKAEQETKTYKRYILNIALDYGGQDEILRAIAKFQELGIKNNELWEEVGKQGKYPIYRFAEYLDTGGQPYPYPDLIIRTGGDLRMSGLLLWQAAYAEYYFAKVHLPDFDKNEFKKAIADYQKRQRRFGGN